MRDYEALPRARFDRLDDHERVFRKKAAEDISAAFFLNASFVVVGAVEVGAREPVVPHTPRSRQRIETTR